MLLGRFSGRWISATNRARGLKRTSDNSVHLFRHHSARFRVLGADEAEVGGIKEMEMLEKLSGETLLYPIIGDPIIFVKSQRLTAEFEARDHNGICVPMQVPDGELESVMRGLGSIPNVRGLLITMPHKSTMFAYCALSSETSKLLGVVNVARRNADGSWHGDLLDGLAFVAAQKKEGAILKGARVLLVGAGGRHRHRHCLARRGCSGTVAPRCQPIKA
jgi:Shikimate dehydrogenase substrate binding domain